MYRILKPGGWGIFQIPQDLNRKTTFEDDSITDSRERAQIFGQYDHVRVYGQDFFDILKEAGFDAKGIDYTSQNLHQKNFSGMVWLKANSFPL